MMKNLKPSWETNKQPVNIKNKIARTHILLLLIYIYTKIKRYVLRDKLGS